MQKHHLLILSNSQLRKPALQTAAMEDSPIKTRLQHLVLFLPVSFQPALSIFRTDDPAEDLSILGPAFIVTSREDELALETEKHDEKGKTSR